MLRVNPVLWRVGGGDVVIFFRTGGVHLGSWGGAGFRVWGLGFRVYGLGFRV